MRRRSLAAPLLAALLLGGCRGEDPYVAPTPTVSQDAVPSVRAAETLAVLQDALASADARSAGRLAATADGEAALEAAAGNVRRLGLDDVTLRFLGETGERGADGTWTATAELTWRLRGFDEVAARAEIDVAFSEDGGAVASLGASGRMQPLWLTGPVAVGGTEQTLVVSTASARTTRSYSLQAGVAIDAVRRVLPGAHRLVVEVPESVAQLHTAVGQEPGTYDAVAAVTTSPDGSLAPGSPVHVFVNPEVYGDLGAVEAQVVMTHEAVHAVTAAPLAPTAPLWLLEGFADFVALRDVDLPVTTTAAQVIRQVRADGPPSALPDRLEFDAQGSHLGAAYEAAWLACVALAERRGEQALVDLYDAVLEGAPVEEELRRRFDWTVAELTAAWQSRLAVLAGVPQ